jgi:hypothetical protein
LFTGFVGGIAGIPPITSLSGQGSAGLSLRQTYSVVMVKNGQATCLSCGQTLYSVPSNVGPRTMPDYQSLFNQGIYSLGNLAHCRGMLYPDGAAVARARVKLQRAALGAEPQATSDAEGHFEFSSIDPGAYQLTAEAHGFMALNLDVAIVSGRASAACLELINCELFQLNDLPLRVSLLAAILTLRAPP